MSADTLSVDKESQPIIIHSVALNNYVGGFNPDVVRATADLARRPIIVWFPTIHAKNFLKTQKLEIPPEWLPSGKRKNVSRPSDSVEGLTILDSAGRIKSSVKKVLKAIKETNSILATGHLGWNESAKLVRYAINKEGIKKIIITHPIYQRSQCL